MCVCVCVCVWLCINHNCTQELGEKNKNCQLKKNGKKISKLTFLTKSSSKVKRAVTGRLSSARRLMTRPSVAAETVAAKLRFTRRLFWCLRGSFRRRSHRYVHSVRGGWLNCQTWGSCCRSFHGIQCVSVKIGQKLEPSEWTKIQLDVVISCF